MRNVKTYVLPGINGLACPICGKGIVSVTITYPMFIRLQIEGPKKVEGTCRLCGRKVFVRAERPEPPHPSDKTISRLIKTFRAHIGNN